APAAAPPSVTASAPCATAQQSGAATRAVVELAKGGAITIALRADKAPRTVENFVRRARSCFYDGLTFHRVVPDFVAQGGDPLGNGTGGGDQPTELSDLPFAKGAVGVARGADIRVSNDTQFFVVIGGQARHLDGQYTNFGQVSAGQEVADAIRVGDRIRTIRVE
ncbi:MAG: peptidylprolyl isomerase, partial [Candidatus Limnocylindria bacterium]